MYNGEAARRTEMGVGAKAEKADSLALDEFLQAFAFTAITDDHKFGIGNGGLLECADESVETLRLGESADAADQKIVIVCAG